MYFGKAIRILFMPGVVVHVFNPKYKNKPQLIFEPGSLSELSG